ncbi:hypothetical protein HS096_02625 [candidate division WWE3 bacterium]|uniref:Uncharacterized protein n=1 Tax=candidate division WWE3 bacterium TaxID=2053526 RepID=A0A928TQD9_UNCKA|nr:hypothetical protein [candidate division WWE3 bacterium]
MIEFTRPKTKENLKEKDSSSNVVPQDGTGEMRPKAKAKKAIFSLNHAIFLLAGLFIFLLSFHPSLAAQGITPQINYQAKLLDSGSIPVANGSYTLKFSIYDAESGGNRLWTASGTLATPASIDVPVTSGGLLSILLGSGTQNSLATVDWNSDSLYLGVTVGSDSEMSPRKRIGAVAQAFNSQSWNGYRTASSVSSGDEVLKLSQTNTSAASSQRTALLLTTSGTSNINDYLLVANNGSSNVFTISRQGHATTTGNLAVSGETILGDAATDFLVVNALVASDFVPDGNGTRSLGTTSNRWNGFFANATSTFLDVSTLTVSTVSASNLTWTNATGTNTTSTNLFTNNLLFAGATGTNANLTGSLNVSGVTSLQNLTFTIATGTSVTTTNLSTTNLAFGSASGSTVSSTNLTFAYATGTILEVSSILTVGGTSVCLQNGTNCPSSSSGDLNWVYDNTNDLVRTTTSTSDVAIGGSTENTSPFFVRVQSTSTRLLLGANGSSTDLVIGASTSSITNTAFQLTGKDLFVLGNIGSASSVYTNGAFVAGSGTTLFGDGFVTKTNGSLTVSASTDILLTPTGNVGVGTSTPSEKLTVVGNIQNTLVQGQTFTLVNTVNIGGSVTNVHVQGDYLFVIDWANDQFEIYNISDPRSIQQVFVTSTNGDPNALYVSGRYAYVVNETGTVGLQIYDISNPASTTAVGFVSVGTRNFWVTVQGKYAYIASITDNILYVVDVSDPRNPVNRGNISLGSQVISVDVQDNYAFVAQQLGNVVSSIDISNPDNPTLVSNVSITSPRAIDVRGGHAYVAQFSLDQLAVIDISNPQQMSVIGSVAVGNDPTGLFVSGRYAYTADNNASAGGISVVDIASSTNPILMSAQLNGGRGYGIHVQGRYAYLGNFGSSTVQIFDVGGTETNALTAGIADIGNLTIRDDAYIASNLSIGGGIQITGIGGLFSLGPIVSADRNSTSTFFGAVSSTRGEFSNQLTVGGVSVCLSNGTNCSGSATPTLQQVTDQGSITTNGITVYGGITTSNLTATGTASSSRMVWTFATGTHTTTTNLFATNALWTNATGTNLFTTNAVFTSATSTNFFSTNVLFTGATGTNANLTGSLNVAGVTSLQNLTFTIATGTSATTTNFFATNLRFTGATGTNAELTSSLTVGGVSVCLQNGTNCPASGSATNFWSYTAATNLLFPATNTVSFALGGATENTAPFFFRRNTTSTRLILGGNGSSTDVVIGATTASNMHTAFQLSGDDLFVAGNIGSASSVYTNGAFIAGTGTTLFGSGFITNTNATLTVSASTTRLSGSFDQIMTSGDSNFVFTRASSTVTGTDPVNVQVVGRYAYVVNRGDSTFQIFDVTDPFAPSSTASISTSSTPQELAVAGRYAYVVASSRLNIFDISSSSQIVPMSSIAVTTETLDTPIHVEGKFAYLAGGTTFTIVDISNPSSPSVVKTLTVGNSIRDVFVRGRFAYLVSWYRVSERNFFVIDVNDPTNPVIHGSVNTKEITGDAGPWAVYVQGSYAYVANQWHDTFSIIDVSNPASPRVRDEIVIGDQPYGVQVQGRYAYVAELGGNSIAVIDVSSSTNATLVQRISLGAGTTPQDLFVSGRYLYVAQSGNEQLSIWKIPGSELISLEANSIEAGTLQVRSKAWVDNELFVGQALNVGTGGIMTNGVLSVSGTATSTIGGPLTVQGKRVCLSDGTNCTADANWTYNGAGNYLTTGTSTLNVLVGGDLTASSSLIVNNPNKMVSVNNFKPNGSGTINGSYVRGNYLYAAGGANFYTIDITNPAAPEVVGTSTGFTNAQWVDVAGKFAYVIDNSTFKMTIVDISQAATPTRLGEVSFGTFVYPIHVKGTYAYVPNYTNGLRIVDISSSTNPFIAASIDPGGFAAGVDLLGNYAYVGNGTGDPDFYVVDISNPKSPVLKSPATFNPGHNNLTVYASGRYAYVAGWDGALTIYDIASSTNLVTKGRVTGLSTQNDVKVAGDYAYMAGTNLFTVLNVSTASSPTVVVATSTPGASYVTIAGKYAYVGGGTSGLYVMDLQGAKISTANIGNLSIQDGSVQRDFEIGNRLNVGGDMQVYKDITAGGLLTILGNGTSTFLGSVSATRGEFTNALTVNGVNVCLSGNINCSGVGGWNYNPSTNSLATATSSIDVLVGIETGTSTFNVLEEVGYTDLGGNGASPQIAVQGDYAYQVDSGLEDLFTIVDISDPVRPREVASTTVLDPTDVTVRGQYAYVTETLNDRLRIFNISSSTRPFEVGSLATGADPSVVAVQGAYAYVVNASAGTLSIVDISDPKSPIEVSESFSSATIGSSVQGIAVSGDFAYLTTINLHSTTKNFTVINVKDPLNPRIEGSTNTHNSGTADCDPRGVVIQGKYAYVANDVASASCVQNAVAIIDVSDPSNPTFAGGSNLGATNIVAARAIAVAGRYAYVASTNVGGGDTNQVAMVDISSSTRPQFINRIGLSNSKRPLDIALQGNYFYVSDNDNNEFTVVKIKGVETQSLVAHAAEIGRLEVRSDGYVAGNFAISGGLTVQGNAVCLANGSGCLWGITADGTITPNRSLADIRVTGDAEFANNVIVLPTSTTAFTTSTIFTFTGVQYGIKIQGDYAYAGVGGRLAIFDISQPSSTQLVSNAFWNSCSVCLPDMFHVAGNYVYLIQDNNSSDTMFQVIDVTDPRNQRRVATFDLGNSGFQAIDGVGKYVYLVNNTDNILVSVDVSNPLSPSLVSSVAVSSTPRDIRVRNGLAYIVSEGTDTISIFDVSNPKAMRELATTSTSLTLPNSSDPRNLDIQGPYAYVMGRTSSTLSIIDISATTTPRVVSQYTTTNANPDSVYVSGRYAYIPMETSSYGIDVVDISTSGTPRRVGFIGTGAVPQDIAIKGRYAFIVEGSGNMRVMDIGAAIETNGLVAHNAEIGQLNVRGNESIGGDLVVRGGAYVGRGGLLVDGGFAVISAATSSFGGNIHVSAAGESRFEGSLYVRTATTNTFLGFVSSTRGEFSQGLSVGGRAVCLRDKTGCPPDALIWTYNSASDTVLTVSSTVDVKIGGSIDNTLVDGDSFKNVSTSTLDGDPKAVKAQGQYVYVAKGNGKLEVFRIGLNGVASSTANVMVTSTAIQDMEVQGRYAYFSLNAGTNNFKVVDLLDPTAPTSVGASSDDSFSSASHYLAVRGKYAYMSGGGKFTVFDITSSTNPFKISQISVAGGLDVYISGNRAYLASASNNQDLQIVDISNPLNPVLLNTIDVPGNGTSDVHVNGHLLYTVPNGTLSADTLRIWDVASSTNASVLGSATIDFQTAETRIVVSGRYAYVSDAQVCNASGNRGRIHVFDVASSTRPIRQIQHLVWNNAHRVTEFDIQGKYLFAGLTDSGTSCANDGTDSLVVIDINGLETNGLIAHSADLGQVSVRGDARFFEDLSVDGTFISYGDFLSYGNFQIGGDLSVGGSISASGTLQITGSITSGNLLPNIHNTYDIGANGTAWKNIYASGTVLATGFVQQMKSAWTIATSSADIFASGLRNPYTVRVQGDYAYVSGFTGNTVGIIKAADGEAPALQSIISMNTSTLALDVSGNYLYVAGYNDRSFRIFDVSSPGDPQEMSSSTFTVLGAIDLRVAGQYAYVSTNDNPGTAGITIIDIADPRKPKQVGRLTGLNSPARFVVRGNTMYLADNTTFKIIDIASSTNPVVLASASCSGNCYSVDVSGHYAFALTRGTPGRILTFDIARAIVPLQVATTTLSVTTDFGANLIARDGIVYWTSGGSAARAGAYRWNPAALAMSFLGEIADATKLTNNDALDIQGNRLFMTGSNSGNTETYVSIIDIGGTTVDSLKAGSAALGSLDVFGDARIDRNLNVLGGVQVGPNGLYSAGDVGISKNLTVVGNMTNILTGSSTLDRAGSLSFSSASLTSIALQGNYVYLSDSREHKVYAVDTTVKSSPATVNTLTVGDGTGDIFVTGNYLYVTNIASPTSSLEIVDISNPGSMTTVATTSLLNPRSVFVQGKYAYVGGSDFSIVDVSNPKGPTIVTSTDPGYGVISDVYVQGRYAFLADTTVSSLHIVDIGDPTNPTIASSTFMDANPRSVYVQGRYAYVAGGDGTTNELRVYTIALPSFPVLRDSVTLEGRPDEVVVHGRYAYVTDIDNNKITVVDVSDPTDIFVVNQTLTTDQPVSMAVGGRYAYVSGKGSSKLEIFDIRGAEINGLIAHSAEFGNMQVLGNGSIYNDLSIGGGLNVGIGGIQTGGSIGAGKITSKPQVTINAKYSSTDQLSAAHVAVRGRYLYMVGGSNILEVIDVQNPQSPVLIATSTLTTSINRLAAEQGRYIFGVGAGSSIDVIDASKPASTTRVHTFTVGGTHEDAFVSGRFLYLIDSSNSVIRIVDVSDPFNPVSRGAVSLPSCTESDVFAQGHFVYATCRGVSGLFYIIDASDPDNPVNVGNYTPGSAVIDIQVQGGYAYLAKLDDTIDIVNITSSTNPTLTSTISGVEDPAIALGGKYLFAGSTGLTTKEIRVYDVSNPSQPALVDTLTLGSSFVGATASLVLSGRYLYFGEASPGNIRIIDTGGMDTGTLQAGAAEIGDLQVLGSGYVQNNLHVEGGFSAGQSAEFHDYVSIHSRVSSTQGILQVHSNCGGSVSARVASFLDASNHLVSIRCNGQLFADNGTIGTGGDYAEYFISNDATLAAGDVVAIDLSSATTVTRGSSSLRPYTLGVVSSNPVVTGMGSLEGHASATLVGLLGQLDTNINASSTPITIGDKLMAGDNGMAVKAKGPGMVLGTALESLASGTGTIRVFVSPHWWAGDLFIASDTGSLLVADLTIASSTMANASTTLVDSPLFSFRGSAYDTGSSTTVTSTFSLWNDMIDTTTTRFTLSHDSTGTSLLTVNSLGDLAISGRFYPSDEGMPQFDKYIFYQATGTPGDYMRTNASGWGTGSYDFAEFFPSAEPLEPGDIVVVDPTEPERVKKSTHIGEGAIVGIVSTKPGFLGGEWKEGHYAIALAGRVPTKVNTENGIIRAGDYLAPSSQPGIAMRATAPGPTAAIALQDYDGTSATSTIIAYVYVGWWGGDDGAGSGASGGTGSAPRAGLAEIASGDKSVEVTFESLGAYPIIHVTPYDLPTGEYGIRNVTDIGFTIVLMQAQTIDLRFAWTAEPSPNSPILFQSNGTSAPYNQTTGEIIQSDSTEGGSPTGGSP